MKWNTSMYYIWLFRENDLNHHGGFWSQGRKETAHTWGKRRVLLGEGTVDRGVGSHGTAMREGKCQESQHSEA